jgi:hypothetical protein
MNTPHEKEKEKKMKEKYCGQLIRLLMSDNGRFDPQKVHKLCNFDDDIQPKQNKIK